MNQGLYEALLREQKEPFLGWDFKYLEQDGRMVEFPTTWHFSTVIKSYLAKSHSMLDMGTGRVKSFYRLLPRYQRIVWQPKAINLILRLQRNAYLH